jgi:predicted Fe-Mo cluster-binding NifX family protein
MKIVFTSKEQSPDSMMDPRFGRANYLIMYDDATREFTAYDNSESAGSAHGAGPLTAKRVYDLQPDVIVTGNGPGEKAAETLKVLNIKMYVGAGEMTVKEALQAWQQGTLKTIEL